MGFPPGHGPLGCTGVDQTCVPVNSHTTWRAREEPIATYRPPETPSTDALPIPTTESASAAQSNTSSPSCCSTGIQTGPPGRPTRPTYLPCSLQQSLPAVCAQATTQCAKRTIRVLHREGRRPFPSSGGGHDGPGPNAQSTPGSQPTRHTSTVPVSVVRLQTTGVPRDGANQSSHRTHQTHKVRRQTKGCTGEPSARAHKGRPMQGRG